MTGKPQILVVEDELLVAQDLREILTGFGYDVPGIANSGAGAIRLAEEKRPDLVLMDINLTGEMDGITAGGEIRSRWGIPIIYATAYASRTIVDRAKKTGPSGFIFKPYNEMQIEIAVEIALHSAGIERQHRALKYLQTHPTITRQEYSKLFECNERTARRDLAALEMQKVIVMEKSGATKLFRLNAVFSTYVDMGGHRSR